MHHRSSLSLARYYLFDTNNLFWFLEVNDSDQINSPWNKESIYYHFFPLYNDFLWLTCSTAMRRQKWGGTTRVKHKQINKGFTFSARHSGQEESGHGNMKLWPSNELNFKQRNSENHRENGAPHSELILKPNNQTTLLCDLRLCGQLNQFKM